MQKVDVSVFTDGSYDPTNKVFGWGFVLQIEGDCTVYKGGASDDEKVIEMRNIAGELKAAMEAVRYCAANGIKEFTIYHDYLGVEKWVTGEWKAKCTVSKLYGPWMADMKAKHKLDIKFEHVKAHSNIVPHDMADSIAKSAIVKFVQNRKQKEGN